GDRRLLGLSGHRGNRFGRSLGRTLVVVRVPFPNAHRPLDVLDGNFAGVGEADVDAIADALIHDRRDADATRLSQRFQTCRDVDAVTVDVVTLDDHVAKIDADPENDAGSVRGRLRPDQALNCKRTFD